MIPNERQSQASTPVVITKDNLEYTERKGYFLKKILKKGQNNKYLL